MERTAAHAVSPDPNAVVCSRLWDGYAGLEGIVNSRIIHFLVFVGKKGIGSSVVLPCFAQLRSWALRWDSSLSISSEPSVRVSLSSLEAFSCKTSLFSAFRFQ